MKKNELLLLLTSLTLLFIVYVSLSFNLADLTIGILFLLALGILALFVAEIILRVLARSDKLSHETGFSLLIAFQPMEHEVRSGKYYTLPFNHLVSDVKDEHRIMFIDLLDYYTTNNILTKQNWSDFYWKINLHHNTKGYETMGNAIAAKVLELKLTELGTTSDSLRAGHSHKGAE